MKTSFLKISGEKQQAFRKQVGVCSLFPFKKKLSITSELWVFRDWTRHNNPGKGVSQSNWCLLLAWQHSLATHPLLEVEPTEFKIRLLKKKGFIVNYAYVCAPKCRCPHPQVRGIGSPRAGVTGGRKPPILGAEILTWVLWKSKNHPYDWAISAAWGLGSVKEVLSFQSLYIFTPLRLENRKVSRGCDSEHLVQGIH